jgi:RNA polymerase sigma-70 factor (ECF subfamily)
MLNEDFVTEFEGVRRALKSYLLRMTASVEDTEDILQDTYLKASGKLDSFKGESSLKTWVFAIASNLARDHLRARKRWTENVTDLSREAAFKNPQFLAESMHIRQTSPQGNFEIREHIAFCFTCVAKSLPLEQHLAVLLKEVHEFKVNEIALIMDISHAMVKYHLHTGRSTMIRIFDGRCALINKEGICHQCTELNGMYNPGQRAAEEAAKIEMARAAGNKDKEHLFDLRMKVVKEIDPFESAAAELQLHHLRHNRKVMEENLKESQE